jgi:hypothetical protein
VRSLWNRRRFCKDCGCNMPCASVLKELNEYSGEIFYDCTGVCAGNEACLYWTLAWLIVTGAGFWNVFPIVPCGSYVFRRQGKLVWEPVRICAGVADIIWIYSVLGCVWTIPVVYDSMTLHRCMILWCRFCFRVSLWCCSWNIWLKDLFIPNSWDHWFSWWYSYYALLLQLQLHKEWDLSRSSSLMWPPRMSTLDGVLWLIFSWTRMFLPVAKKSPCFFALSASMYCVFLVLLIQFVTNKWIAVQCYWTFGWL